MEETTAFTDTPAFLGIVIAVGAIVLCTIMCLVTMNSNKKWLEQKRVEYESLSEIAETSKGKIEFRKFGNAPYMLFMPGTPGFCHAAVGFDKFGFGLITVSRPGYGRTPLTEELKKSSA